MNFLAVTLLWLRFKRKLEFPEEGSNHSEGPLLSVPQDATLTVSCHPQPRDRRDTQSRKSSPPSEGGSQSFGACSFPRHSL